MADSIEQSNAVHSWKSMILRGILTTVLSLTIASGAILMIGPQVVFIIPFAMICGIALVAKQSYWSMVFLGYPLTFGLVSAWIGYCEIEGYHQTKGFLIAVTIGSIGLLMIASGLWKAFSISSK